MSEPRTPIRRGPPSPGSEMSWYHQFERKRRSKCQTSIFNRGRLWLMEVGVRTKSSTVWPGYEQYGGTRIAIGLSNAIYKNRIRGYRGEKQSGTWPAESIFLSIDDAERLAFGLLDTISIAREHDKEE